MSEDHVFGDQVQPQVPAVTNANFLRAVFGDDADRVHVAAFGSDPSSGTAKDARERWAGNLARRMLRTFRIDENAYFVVSLFQQDYVDDATGRARRKKDRFESMRMVCVDDVGPKVDRALILRKMGEPTYRLETSPGNEQWGYVFDESLLSRHQAEALVNGMIAAGITADGKDPGMSAVTRYVRLPVGRNSKATYGPDGFACRLRSWNPERRFSYAAIALVWSIDLDAAEREARKAEQEWQRRALAPPARERDEADWMPQWSRALPAQNHPHAAAFLPADMEQDAIKTGGMDDPLFLALRRLRLVKGSTGPQQWDITCPFVTSHTGRADNGTAFMPGGGIACHHGHCVGRGRAEYVAEVARRLRRGGDEDKALADRLQPPRRAARPLAPDMWADMLRAANAFAAAARKPDFNQRRSLASLAMRAARYVQAGRAAEDAMRDAAAPVVQEAGIPLAAWHAAFRWAMATARQEGTTMT